MVRLQLSIADVGRMRFAFSPLLEVAESLYLLASDTVPSVHRQWYGSVRGRLGQVDMELLTAVVPARRVMADFFFALPGHSRMSFDRQVEWVETLPSGELRRQLEEVWAGDRMPAAAFDLVKAGQDGVHHLAEVLRAYWSVAIEPYWRAMRAVLEEDVAYRAAELTKVGLEGMLGQLHPRVSVAGDEINIGLCNDRRLVVGSTGVVLMPSIFVWPNIALATDAGAPPRLTYAARGVGTVWENQELDAYEGDALGALLGRSRAAILMCLSSPHSTTELAVKLGQSKPAVSQHLSALRRCGLVTFWRSGRSVMYRRTLLATSIVEARHTFLDSPVGEP